MAIDNVRANLYLQPDTLEAIKTVAAREGLTNSAAAEALLQRGLSAAAAEAVGMAALPAIEDGTRRAVADELAIALQPLREQLRAIYLEATMARLETYAALAYAYGPDEATHTEMAAQRQAEAARARGIVARLTGTVHRD